MVSRRSVSGVDLQSGRTLVTIQRYEGTNYWLVTALGTNEMYVAHPRQNLLTIPRNKSDLKEEINVSECCLPVVNDGSVWTDARYCVKT